MNLADLIARNAAFTPDKAALRFEGTVLTYRVLAERIVRAAGILQSGLGVRPGDRIAVIGLNHPETLVLLYACARLGAILLPMNWRLAPAEQLFILADAEVCVVFAERAFEAVLAPLRERLPESRMVGLDHAPEGGASWADLMAIGGASQTETRDAFAGRLADPLLLVYTSGTTGRPKGAVLRQEALVWNAAMSQHMHALTAEDHVLSVLPFFHVGGLNIQTTPALHVGASVTIHPRFAPETTLRALGEERPTLTVLVPATIQALVEHPGWAQADLSSLRALSTGSTFVPQALIDAVEARGVPLLQVYGSTETCPVAVYTRIDADRRRPGSTGLPGLFCEARITDARGREVEPGISGEIAIRGPQVFDGYWRNPVATAEVLDAEGWFCTGDIGLRDRDGYVTIHDRKKNMIISGGENIYPAEIERVLLTHPDVAEAAVIGRADPRWGEVPVARVVLRPGSTGNAEDLIDHVRGELARFKAPREIRFVDALPRNALGKVQHFRVRAAAEQDEAPCG